jgi:hypothetical protein
MLGSFSPAALPGIHRVACIIESLELVWARTAFRQASNNHYIAGTYRKVFQCQTAHRLLHKIQLGAKEGIWTQGMEN